MNYIPLHPPIDRDYVDELCMSMRDNGWLGRPLAGIIKSGYTQLLTGSHRYSAAMHSNITFPVISLSYEKYPDIANALLSAHDDVDRSSIAEKAMQDYPELAEFCQLLIEEENLNCESLTQLTHHYIP